MKREERLTKPRQYTEVYGKGASWPSRFLVMRALPNNLALSRFGFSVSKRVGNAVTRNKMKRRLKEIVRNEPVQPGWDIVYIVRPAAVDTDFSSLKASVEGILFKAGLLENKW